KLAARLEGWGGVGLTDSYTVERRPVAQRITKFSTGNLEIMRGAKSDARLFEDTPEGAAIRARVGQALEQGLKREWHCLNMHLGYRYMDSPVICYEAGEDRQAVEAENEQGAIYTPTTRPGCRAPHGWLQDGRSTLDLYGRGFVLVCRGNDEDDLISLRKAVQELAVPLSIEQVRETDISELYQRRYVLVRPDGHVAWRGDQLPADAMTLLRKVAGHEDASAIREGE
nr:2-polyprenyl-6-methoxyphenol hydroxylase [Pseudomonas sp.]